jgi:hypothetical protein
VTNAYDPCPDPSPDFYPDSDSGFYSNFGSGCDFYFDFGFDCGSSYDPAYPSLGLSTYPSSYREACMYPTYRRLLSGNKAGKAI